MDSTFWKGAVIFLFFLWKGIKVEAVDCNGKPFLCTNSEKFYTCMEIDGKMKPLPYIHVCPAKTYCSNAGKKACDLIMLPYYNRNVRNILKPLDDEDLKNKNLLNNEIDSSPKVLENFDAQMQTENKLNPTITTDNVIPTIKEEPIEASTSSNDVNGNHSPGIVTTESAITEILSSQPTDFVTDDVTINPIADLVKENLTLTTEILTINESSTESLLLELVTENVSPIVELVTENVSPIIELITESVSPITKLIVENVSLVTESAVPIQESVINTVVASVSELASLPNILELTTESTILNQKVTGDLNSIKDELSATLLNNATIQKFYTSNKSKNVITIANSTNQFKCTKEGKFQNTNDCQKYHHCIKTVNSGNSTNLFQNIGFKCAQDKYFNPETSKCTTNASVCTTLLRQQFSCSTFGRFQSEGLPTKFIWCIPQDNGSFYQMYFECQVDQIFDESKDECIHSVNANPTVELGQELNRQNIPLDYFMKILKLDYKQQQLNKKIIKKVKEELDNSGSDESLEDSN